MWKSLKPILLPAMIILCGGAASASDPSQDLTECAYTDVELTFIQNSETRTFVCRGLDSTRPVIVVAENVLACSWRQNSSVEVKSDRSMELGLDAERKTGTQLTTLPLKSLHSCNAFSNLQLSPPTGYRVAPAGPGNKLGHFAAQLSIAQCHNDAPPNEVAAGVTCFAKLGKIRISN